MPSTYTDAVLPIVQEIDQAFANVFHLITPYQSADILPGDRYGILDWQTYSRDADRPALAKVRGGIEAKEFRGSLLLTIGIDGTDKAEGVAYRECNIAFMREAFNLEDGLAAMKQQMNAHGFIYELDLDGTVDKAVSVSLRDKHTYLVNVTADVKLQIMVKRDLDGQYISPL